MYDFLNSKKPLSNVHQPQSTKKNNGAQKKMGASKSTPAAFNQLEQTYHDNEIQKYNNDLRDLFTKYDKDKSNYLYVAKIFLSHILEIMWQKFHPFSMMDLYI